MEKRYKDILRPLVAELRRTLAGTADGSTRGDLDRELERLGIMPDGTVARADVVSNPSEAERRARAVAAAELGAIADVKERIAARAAFVERAAYGWINRLLALRVLEARGLIDETLRQNPDYDGLSEALYVLRQSDPARTSGPDGGWWAVIEDACAAQAAALPGLFGLDAASGTSSAALYDPAIALRPSTTALLRCVELLGASPGNRRLKPPGKATSAVETAGPDDYPAVSTAGQGQEQYPAVSTASPASPAVLTASPASPAVLTAGPLDPDAGPPTAGPPTADAAFADPDAIGWAYQFYQEEAKAQVYAGLKGGKKVGTRDDIAAATQLFTEPYMVKWLLQNSLGRGYHEAYPWSALPARWEYYIRPEPLDAPAFPTLENLTLLDPCMGSGHFLREAFDMLVTMYHEQQPELDATTIADRILAQHLHGIDIDPRAAQLAAFTLYARAWELVRDERRARRQPGSGSYTPAALNLATTPGRIAPGALARHLQRHPGDRPLEPLLQGVFTALENADILGSLLRPREHLAAAIAELRRPRQLQMQPDPDLQAVQDAIENVLHTDPSRLEDMLLERVATSFATEAGGADDVAAALFGREAERGVRLLQLLDRRYSIVATNPPYMGSANMANTLKNFTERHYSSGKRDLYAVFILRCLECCAPSGRVAMVTKQGWLLDHNFADFRALSEEEMREARLDHRFTGILRTAQLDLLAQLGAGAFSEITGEVVKAALFVLHSASPIETQTLRAIDASVADDDEARARLLIRAATGQVSGFIYRIRSAVFLRIAASPIIFWIPEAFQQLFLSGSMLGKGDDRWFSVKDGMNTGDNERFVRFVWEAQGSRWRPYSKGGGYSKWRGLEYYRVDWGSKGERIVAARLPGTRFQNTDLFFLPALCYSLMSQGALGVRLSDNSAYDGGGLSIQPETKRRESLIAILNCRVVSYFARMLSQDTKFRGGYVERIPRPPNGLNIDQCLIKVIILLKRAEISRALLEPEFDVDPHFSELGEPFLVACLRHAIEGLLESCGFAAYGVDSATTALVQAQVGTPAGWHPLVRKYDAIPSMPDSLSSLGAADVLDDHLEHHQRLELDNTALIALKSRLRHLFEAGPGTTVAVEADTAEDTGSMSGKPMPTETFLEELSQKLQIHPISVYWLLQEIRAEGARCKPEEQRLLEDRLTVIVLRLLGHRWPKQIEAGEPVAEWADRDGIIPLQAGSGEAPLAERVRERLRAEAGDLGAQQAEALLAELTGRSLEEWLRRDFFPRHVRQFKYRPIAWHLASTPQVAGASGTKGRGKGGTRQTPAFECLVYYHAVGVGLLARIRTQYVEPLLHAERGRESAAHQAGDDTTAAQANARVRELEAFTERLRRVEEQGFACAELETLIGRESLDRWGGDGILAPSSHDALLAREQAWTVDINDGVRVNIAPVQLAGVLASGVLKEPDARKAIADRARWRADERRWVREGVLPRCGWMAEDVPESPRWTERAPEREAERARLEAKRAEAPRKLEGATG